MERLWEERNKSGDYLVQCQVDGKEERFHSAILATIPFFRLQLRSSLSSFVSEHTTKLTSATFISFMEFLYLGSTAQFDALNAIELRNREFGLEFYYARKKMNLSCLLASRIHLKYFSKKNCVQFFLLAHHRKLEKEKELVLYFISENPIVISDLSNLEVPHQLELMKEVSKFLFKKNFLLETENKFLKREKMLKEEENNLVSLPSKVKRASKSCSPLHPKQARKGTTRRHHLSTIRAKRLHK